MIFINFRNDRAKEMTIALTQEDMPEQGMKTIPGLQYYCMTPYDANFKGVHILFPKENVEDTLGEYLSKQGKKQLHTAETEKYAHVTFFFNGGREAPYEGEDRILVPSPKVATYDLKPEMSAYEVKDKLVAAINEAKYDFMYGPLTTVCVRSLRLLRLTITRLSSLPITVMPTTLSTPMVRLIPLTL